MDMAAFVIPHSMVILGQSIGRGQNPYLIAEIGNNHNGSRELALQHIEAAKYVGAHAVKFQKRNLPEVFTQSMMATPQMFHQSLGKTYGEYRRTLELSDDDLIACRKKAHAMGLAFGVTPFDISSADALEYIGVDFYKLASFDSHNTPLAEHVAKKGVPVIMSTGMAHLEEIQRNVAAILPHNTKLALLHCVSVYPTPEAETNLGAIESMLKEFSPLPIGYSGHEIGYEPTLMAIGLGACVIERHFTLDKDLPGPDHATVSLDVAEFYNMAKHIRKLRVSLADKRIYLSDKEAGARKKHSKSVVTRVAIPAGTVLTTEMLAFKSPGHGFKPYEADKVIGRTAKEDIPADTVLLEIHLG